MYYGRAYLCNFASAVTDTFLFSSLLLICVSRFSIFFLAGVCPYRDQALYQTVAESLTHSGVMTNFERPSARTAKDKKKSEWTEAYKMKWHDLNDQERCEAASQVHALVFAQLGALAHSMMEFGCGLERSCAFVRRMAVRNQLPMSQRAMLLQHLMADQLDDGAEKVPTKLTTPSR